MGAQYITGYLPTSHEDSLSLKFIVDLYKDLTAQDLLKEMSGHLEGEIKPSLNSVVPTNYVAPNGMSSICKHFLNQSKAKIRYQHKLCSVDVTESSIDKGRKKIHCVAESSEGSEFNAVMLTLPVPQLLQLKGNALSSLSPKLRVDLAAVKYSSRYALGLFFDSTTVLSSPGVFKSSWTAKYFDDPVVRFVCWDSIKRGCTDSQGRTLLIHTTVPFGLEHLEDEKEDVQSLIIQTLDKLIPGLPPPTHSHMIRWRYSQVCKQFPGSHDYVVLSHDPLIIATGDSFCGSKFNNCVQAAQSTAQVISESLA